MINEDLLSAKVNEAGEALENGNHLKSFNDLMDIYNSVKDDLDSHKDLGINIFTGLSDAATAIGKPLTSLEFSKKLLEFTRKHFPNDIEKELEALNQMAYSYNDLQEDYEALKIFEEVYTKSREFYRETDAAAIDYFMNYIDALSKFPNETEKLVELENYGIKLPQKMLDEFKVSPQKDEESFDKMVKNIENLEEYFIEIRFEKELIKVDTEVLSIAREVYPKNSMKLVRLMERVATASNANKGLLLLKEAFQIEKNNAKTDVELVEAFENYGMYCRFIGKEKENKKVEKQLETIVKRVIDSFMDEDENAPYDERLQSLKKQSEFFNKYRDPDNELDVWAKICALTENKDAKENVEAMEHMAVLYGKNRDRTALSMWEKIWNIRKNDENLRDGLRGVFMKWLTDCFIFGAVEETLVITEKALRELVSPDISDAIFIREILAGRYKMLERFDEELAIRELIVDMNRKYYGEDSLKTLGAKFMEISTLLSLGKNDEAIDIAYEIYQKNKELFGEFNVMAIDKYSNYIKVLCSAGKTDKALEEANMFVKKLSDYKPDAESENLMSSKSNAQNTLDACLLLYHAKEAEFADIRTETLEEIEDGYVGEIPKLKDDFLIRLWKEASGKKFKASKNHPRPWSTEISKSNKFFCLNEDKIYRVEKDKTYLFDDGWKEAAMLDEYTKISEADALEGVWKVCGDVKKFFSVN